MKLLLALVLGLPLNSPHDNQLAKRQDSPEWPGDHQRVTITRIDEDGLPYEQEMELKDDDTTRKYLTHQLLTFAGYDVMDPAEIDSYRPAPYRYKGPPQQTEEQA
ncbi:MAG: hypothetical protein Q9157_001743 [Trypethelium eluteriae]